MNRQLQDYLNGNPSYEDLDVAMRASMRVSDNILKRIKEVGGDVEDTVMDEGTAHEANDEDGEGPGGEEDGVDDEDNEEEKEDDDDDMDVRSPAFITCTGVDGSLLSIVRQHSHGSHPQPYLRPALQFSVDDRSWSPNQPLCRVPDQVLLQPQTGWTCQGRRDCRWR